MVSPPFSYGLGHSSFSFDNHHVIAAREKDIRYRGRGGKVVFSSFPLSFFPLLFLHSDIVEGCLISPKRSGRLEDAPAAANFQTQKEPSHGSGVPGGVPTLYEMYVEVGQTSFALHDEETSEWQSLLCRWVSGRGEKLLRQAVYEIGGFPTHRFFARKSLWSGESLSAKLVSNFFNSHPLTTPEGMDPRLTPQPLPIKFEKEGR